MLIDNIFLCSKLQNSLRSGIIYHDISDHFPIIAIIKGILAKKREQKIVYTRDVTDCKVHAVQHDLDIMNWPVSFQNKDINECYETFHTVLSETLDKHMPIHEIKIPAKQYICEPWVSKGLRKCDKKQLQLYKKGLRSGNEDDMLRYKNYKSTL